MPTVRGGLLAVAAAGACLSLASVAYPQAASTTASGTLVGVQNDLQIVNQSNGDGTVSKCGVIGGTLRTEAGDINFGAGGVLTPDGVLEPSTQTLIDTLHEGARMGTTVVATITYVPAGTLCGHTGTVVTGASLTPVTPAPAPAPAPALPASQSTPQPTTQTVSGIVTRMSAFAELIRGPTSLCEMWPGILKTAAGPSLLFAVETATTGSLETSVEPSDPAAFPQAKLLQAARIFGTRAPVTMTYTGPVNACGYLLEAVVTTATVAFPSPYDTKPEFTRRGRVTRMSGPSVVSGNGSTCQVWDGSLTTTRGERTTFSVETPLAGSPPRAADRRAVKTAATLRRALAKRATAVAAITFAGPVIACGRTLDRVVTKASIATRPGHHA